MGEHNNAIAVLIFFMVLFIALSIFIPIGAKEGWFDNIWEYIIHGNHPQEKEVPDDEQTEPDNDDTDTTTEITINYNTSSGTYHISYKN